MNVGPRLRAHHLVLVLVPLLYFAALANVPLQLPDEPREAELARELWVNGPLHAPRVNDAFHPVKPPLAYWVASLFFTIEGETVPGELSVRLAPALFTVLSALLAFVLGRAWWSVRHGALAALVLALSPEVLVHGRRLTSDPALMLCVTGAVGAAVAALGHARWRLLASVAGASLGLGFLAKGPVAVVLAGCALAGIVAIRRPPVARVLGGVAIATPFVGAAVALWLWILARDGGEELVRWYVRYHVGGLSGKAGTPHVQPWWFYLTSGSDGFLPWMVFLPLLRWARDEAPDRPTRGQLLAWVLVPGAFLSIMAQKRDVYTLPLFPPLALLAARALLDAPREGLPGRVGRGVWWLLQVSAVLGAAGGAVGGLAHGLWEGDAARATWGGLLLGVSVLVAVVSARDPDERAAPLSHPFGTLGLCAVAASSIVLLAVPVLKADQTLRPTMRAIIETVRPPERLYGYELGDETGVVDGALAFELGRTFPDVEGRAELARVLADPHARVLAHREAYVTAGKPGRIVREFRSERGDLVLFAPD